MKSQLSRAILVLHRYLGVLVGVLMTVWCLSGFVMMYQDYPSVSQEERLASLTPLDLSGPLALENLPFLDSEPIDGFRVEMLGDRPLLRTGGRGGGANYDLTTGREMMDLSVEEVADLARLYAAGNNIAARGEIAPRLMEDMDQWTIQPFRSSQPLYHIAFNDPAGSEAYISASSGSIVQDTNRKERVLNWLGAIPHWLYPTVLRQNAALWNEVVVWASVIGTFLTVTGIYVGIGRITRRKGNLSPYRGLWWWHHMLGLFFGILTMTWVFSGLLTMSPWGLLGGSPNTLRQDITGSVTWAETRALLESAGEGGLPAGTVQLQPAALSGQLHVLAHGPGRDPVRLDGRARPAPLGDGEVRDALSGLPLASFEHMTGEDSYHYSYKDRQAQPVYRAILDDEQRTRIYIDAATGQLGPIVDDAGRQSRWLRVGLHRLDFISGRPLWDILTLLLLAGVTAVCATGAWMSIRRVARDIKMLRRGRRRNRQPLPPQPNPGPNIAVRER